MTWNSNLKLRVSSRCFVENNDVNVVTTFPNKCIRISIVAYLQ